MNQREDIISLKINANDIATNGGMIDQIPT